MANISFWQPERRTAAAMARLCWAIMLIRCVPFARWRRSIGLTAQSEAPEGTFDIARRAAADIEWAVKKLPFVVKCLPQAMALSWELRRRGIAHAAVIAVRPNRLRGSPDGLHAWIEVGHQKVIGNLPGPWIETLRLGG